MVTTFTEARYLKNKVCELVEVIKIISTMKKITVVCIALFAYILTTAQFQVIGINGGETTNVIDRIGLGNFGSIGDIQSRLHINNLEMFDAMGH